MSLNASNCGSLPQLRIPSNDNSFPISPNHLESPVSPVRKPIFSLEEAIKESGIIGHARSTSSKKRKHRPSPYTLQVYNSASDSGGSSGSANHSSESVNKRSSSAYSSSTSLISLQNEIALEGQQDPLNLQVPSLSPTSPVRLDAQNVHLNYAHSNASQASWFSGYPSSASMQATSSSQSLGNDSANLYAAPADIICKPPQEFLVPQAFSVSRQPSPEPVVSKTSVEIDDEELGSDPLSRRGKRGLRLTTNDRKRICEYSRKHPELSQDTVGAAFGVERTTVSKVLKEAKKWLSAEDEPSSPQQPTSSIAESGQAESLWSNHAARFPQVEQLVITWIRQENTAGRAAPDLAIREAARHFAVDVGINYDQFKASDGWLIRFKSRAGLRKDGYLRGFHDAGMSPPVAPLSCPPAFSASFAPQPAGTSPMSCSPSASPAPLIHSPSTTSFVDQPMLLRDNVGNTMTWTNAQNQQSLQYAYSPVEELAPSRSSRKSTSSVGTRSSAASSSSRGSGYFAGAATGSSSSSGPHQVTPASSAASPALDSKISLNDALQANFTLWRYLHEKNKLPGSEGYSEETAILIDIYRRLSGVIS